MEHTGSDADYVEKDELYQALRSWLKAKGIKREVSRDKFFKDLKNEGIEARQSREHGMKRLYFGITLTECNNVTSNSIPYNNTHHDLTSFQESTCNNVTSNFIPFNNTHNHLTSIQEPNCNNVTTNPTFGANPSE
ncbi:MAG: hypothetical protein QHG94_08595, partial [Candidatus Methanosuratincola sp.]|nr:hypothetical protein [Candidatus Methanosuratincola sp.]